MPRATAPRPIDVDRDSILRLRDHYRSVEDAQESDSYAGAFAAGALEAIHRILEMEHE